MRKKEKRKKEIKKNKKQHQLTLSNPNNAYMDIAIAMQIKIIMDHCDLTWKFFKLLPHDHLSTFNNVN